MEKISQTQKKLQIPVVKTRDGKIFEGPKVNTHIAVLEHFGLNLEDVVDTGFKDSDSNLLWRGYRPKE